MKGFPMPVPNTLVNAVDELRAQLAGLEEQAEKIRVAIRSLTDVMSPPVATPAPDKGNRAHGVNWLRGRNMNKAAAMVLREAGAPMHVNDIMERMLAGGFRAPRTENLRMSLVGTLDRGARDNAPGWFVKTAPATYAMRPNDNGNTMTKTDEHRAATTPAGSV